MYSFQEIKRDNKKNKALILACGPSLSKISDHQVRELSQDHLIITIKQSYNKFKKFSDFQFFNCNNLVIYPREKAKFICCSPASPHCGLWANQDIDIFFHMSEHRKKMSSFKNLEDFFKEENMGKFLGPGIMFEIVMPFVFNLGIKEIITAGWDYQERDCEISHFYNESDRNGFKNKAALPYKGENAESIKNSGALNLFFKNKNISLSCLHSESCFLDTSIKRIKI